MKQGPQWLLSANTNVLRIHQFHNQSSPKALEAEETRKRRAELDDQCGRLQILRDPVGIELGR